MGHDITFKKGFPVLYRASSEVFKMRWLGRFFLGIGFLASFPGLCLAQRNPLLGPAYFSATIDTSFHGRKVTSRFFLSNLKVRLEPEIPGAKIGPTYEIILPETPTMTMVMPAQHLCMKKDLPPETRAQMQAMGSTALKNSDLVVVGHGTLDGHPVIERILTFRSGNPGTPRSIRFWNATDLKNVPIREVVTMANGDVYELHYRNISLQNPPPSLFVPPANCMSFPDIGSMMKNFGLGNHPSIP